MGIEAEMGYWSSRLGTKLQKDARSQNTIGRFLGRILLGYGEQKAEVIRDPKTGRVREIHRKGEA